MRLTRRTCAPSALMSGSMSARGGQRWTTMADLASDHAVVVRAEEPGLLGVGMEPSFAIGQRALLEQTPQGNVLWDCTSLLDDGARARIAELGGISAICMSHPHFYAANVEFADAFGADLIRARTSSGFSGHRRASSSSMTRPSRCPQASLRRVVNAAGMIGVDADEQRMISAEDGGELWGQWAVLEEWGMPVPMRRNSTAGRRAIGPAESPASSLNRRGSPPLSSTSRIAEWRRCSRFGGRLEDENRSRRHCL